MTYLLFRSLTILALMAGSTWLIARHRVIGTFISVWLGWGILYLAFNAVPAPVGIWDEDREEIGTLAPFMMAFWCLSVWAFFTLRRWLGGSRIETVGTKLN